MKDRLQSVLWCANQILENRKYVKHAKIGHLVAELDALIEMRLILASVKADLNRVGPTCSHPARNFSHIDGAHPENNHCDVCEAVGAAYTACAEHCNSRIKTAPTDEAAVAFALASEEIRRLTPADAARALREHDNALIEKCAKLCESAKVRPDGSCAGHTILDCHSSDAYWIRSTLPHPVEEEK